MKRLTGLLVLSALWAMTGTASAHPLGNFTTNLHLGLRLNPDGLNVTLVVDMAEIPAFREKKVIDLSGDELVSDAERADYAVAACEAHRRAIALEVVGESLLLDGEGAELTFPPGQGGLETLRLECQYRAAIELGQGELTVTNDVYADRLGWSEIVVQSEQIAVITDLPSVSPSAVLTSYPSGPTFDERAGQVSFRPGTGTGESASTGNGESSPTLVERIGSGVVGGSGAFALLAALALGAGHALAPGHGKTLMAAYLVGRRGGTRTAIGLGFSVALSHTIGVGILGLITALTTSAFQPETVYPWLSLISATIVTSIGAVMLVRALRGNRSFDHDHPHDHEHPHPHEHEDLPGRDRHQGAGWRSLAALGLAGGLVPSASAVVLLLGAVAQGEAWWGLLLVAGFGLGMSVSLIGAGLLTVGAQKWGWTRIRSERWRQAWQRRVPLVGGLAVALIGIWLVWDTSRRFFS
ncbi:MAG: nickel/cobalt transporter [Acidimicrobiia bacterium]